MTTANDDRVPCATPGCGNHPMAATAARLGGLCMPCFQKTGQSDPGVRNVGVVPNSVFTKADPKCSPAMIEQAMTFISRVRQQDSEITIFDLGVARNQALQYYQGFEECPPGFHRKQFGEIWATIDYWHGEATSLQTKS